MKIENARELASVAGEYATWLVSAIEDIRRECPQDEADLYADGIARVLEHLRGDILAPIYQEHPQLRPEHHDPPEC